jgi:hypothetical protein
MIVAVAMMIVPVVFIGCQIMNVVNNFPKFLGNLLQAIEHQNANAMLGRELSSRPFRYIRVGSTTAAPTVLTLTI